MNKIQTAPQPQIHLKFSLSENTSTDSRHIKPVSQIKTPVAPPHFVMKSTIEARQSILAIPSEVVLFLSTQGRTGLG